MFRRIVLWVCFCLCLIVFPVAALAQSSPDPGPPPCPPTTPDGQPFPCPEDVQYAYFEPPIVSFTFFGKTSTTVQTYVEIGNQRQSKKGFGGMNLRMSNFTMGWIGDTQTGGSFRVGGSREGIFLVYLEDQNGKFLPQRPLIVQVEGAKSKYRENAGFPRMKQIFQTGDPVEIEVSFQETTEGPFYIRVEGMGPHPWNFFYQVEDTIGETKVYRKGEMLRFLLWYEVKGKKIPIKVTDQSLGGTYYFRVNVEDKSHLPVAGGTIRTAVWYFSHPGDIEPPVVEGTNYWAETIYIRGSFPKDGLPRVLLNGKKMEHLCDRGDYVRVSYADRDRIEIPFHVEDIKATVYTVDLYWESTGLHTQTTLRVAQDPKSLPRR